MILPRENEPDLEELPAETRNELEFVLADSIEEVFDAAFDGKRATTRRAARPAQVAAGRARTLSSSVPTIGENRAARRGTNGRTDMAKTRDRVTGAASNVRPYVERAVDRRRSCARTSRPRSRRRARSTTS